MAKNQYLVTLRTSDRDALADIIDFVGGRMSIEISTVGNDAAPKPRVELAPRVTAVRAPRKTKRVSKVNQAILDAVKNYPASVAVIKASLEHAGMSAGSFSTGIAALTKSGQIERTAEGMYGLKQAKAAE